MNKQNAIVHILDKVADYDPINAEKICTKILAKGLEGWLLTEAHKLRTHNKTKAQINYDREWCQEWLDDIKRQELAQGRNVSIY